MTEHVLLDGRVVIVDDALERPVVDLVQQAIEGTAFRRIDPNTGRIWRRNLPLNPEIGERMVWPERPSRPASSAFDLLVDVALAAARRHRVFERASVIETYGGATATPFRYTAGTRLVWHTDGDYLGAFVAYLSPEWTENGGGWLAVQDGDGGDGRGVATIIAPHFNRVVVFAGGVRHSVLSVAGDVSQPRYSLGGFFLTADQIRTLTAARILEECRRQSPNENTHV